MNNNGYEDLFMTRENTYDIILNKKTEIKTIYASGFQLCKTMRVRGGKCTKLFTDLLGGWMMGACYSLFMFSSVSFFYHCRSDILFV